MYSKQHTLTICGKSKVRLSEKAENTAITSIFEELHGLIDVTGDVRCTKTSENKVYFKFDLGYRDIGTAYKASVKEHMKNMSIENITLTRFYTTVK